MQLEQLLQQRFSTRKFKPQQLPRATIIEMLRLAQQTPSWCNIQPWRPLILSGAATDEFRDALYAHAASGAKPDPDFAFPPTYEGEHRERRKVCGVQLYQAVGVGKDDRAGAARQALENFRLFGAPHVALIFVDDYLGFYGALDCGLYVMSFLLAAQSFGISTIAQASLASYPDFVRSRFGIEASHKLICAVSFGYGENAHPINNYRTERAEIEQVARFVG